MLRSRRGGSRNFRTGAEGKNFLTGPENLVTRNKAKLVRADQT